MSAAEPIDTTTYPLDHEPIEEWQRLDPAEAEGPAAETTTAFAELGTIGDVDYGLWEMSTGAMRDVEGDEVFLVLSGAGRIEFDDPVQEPVALAPGSLVRLTAGMKTRWYIEKSPLRKLFIAPSED
ncbi:MULTISPECIES: cupin domain-containing protein [unclassified Brevibacterium]|uniref:cupin domain-containing protein n=1 Tax=unclassified Brevibacterium TaxID=2614124 RepID=UPI0010F7619F|nr:MULTISPECIES: cupin domain-containing protein [unclassified Brevibacterium]MCM1013036.1 cupin domain-containing protein [Brevibacterium sp. XM4083]